MWGRMTSHPTGSWPTGTTGEGVGGLLLGAKEMCGWWRGVGYCWM